MWTPWRLPKYKRDKVTLPDLPRGYYWVLFRQARIGEEVVIRKRRMWPFHSEAVSAYAYEDRKRDYQNAVEKCVARLVVQKDEDW